MSCPNCGAAVDDDDEICDSCGISLNEGQETDQPSQGRPHGQDQPQQGQGGRQPQQGQPQQGPVDTHPTELSGSELEELKRDRLQYTVEYAYEHSPFYRELMDENDVEPADIQTFEDLTQLPVVTGDDIIANQPPQTDTFRFKIEDAQTRRPYHSSGTGGQPKTVFRSYGQEERIQRDAARGYKHFGTSEGDVAVNLFPFVGLNPSCSGVERGLAAIGCETLPISNTPYPPERLGELLQRHNPDEIHGLPSHLDTKGRQLREAGYDPAELGLDRVVTTGEPVSENRKNHLKQVFETNVYDYLGATEMGSPAFECLETDRFHVLDESVHVEIVDSTGESVQAGKEGRLVMTHLIPIGEESSMPLIRYDLGDKTAKYEDNGDCDCSLSGGSLIDPPRREDDHFTVGAVTITPYAFGEEIYSHPTLKEISNEYRITLRYDEKKDKMWYY